MAAVVVERNVAGVRPRHGEVLPAVADATPADGVASARLSQLRTRGQPYPPENAPRIRAEHSTSYRTAEKISRS
jgi:hypothetical protein